MRALPFCRSYVELALCQHWRAGQEPHYVRIFKKGFCVRSFSTYIDASRDFCKPYAIDCRAGTCSCYREGMGCLVALLNGELSRLVNDVPLGTTRPYRWSVVNDTRQREAMEYTSLTAQQLLREACALHRMPMVGISVLFPQATYLALDVVACAGEVTAKFYFPDTTAVVVVRLLGPAQERCLLAASNRGASVLALDDAALLDAAYGMYSTISPGNHTSIDTAIDRLLTAGYMTLSAPQRQAGAYLTKNWATPLAGLITRLAVTPPPALDAIVALAPTWPHGPSALFDVATAATRHLVAVRP